MKNLFIAILAVLMLAGVLCAISGATPIGSSQPVQLVGEGASPLPTLLSSGGQTVDTAVATHF